MTPARRLWWCCTACSLPALLRVNDDGVWISDRGLRGTPGSDPAEKESRGSDRRDGVDQTMTFPNDGAVECIWMFGSVKSMYGGREGKYTSSRRRYKLCVTWVLYNLCNLCIS
jgi:hypothetical protein